LEKLRPRSDQNDYDTHSGHIKLGRAIKRDPRLYDFLSRGKNHFPLRPNFRGPYHSQRQYPLLN
jgi:hypothetical protein